MKERKKYWKGLAELKGSPELELHAKKEFPDYLPINEGEGDPSRRDFLKVMGFGMAAVSLAACETPVRKAIPYVTKPTSVDPSIANYYASTYLNGSDVASVVVKTREGRPIKIEGNELASTTGGGTSTQIEASVLSLYDKRRFTDPMSNGAKTTWEALDQGVATALSAASGKVYLVSHTVSSPSTLKAIEKLKGRYPNVQHVVYDQYSFDGTLSANEASFEKRALASYDYSKAKTIVAFDADFLGTWPDKVLNNKQYASGRKLNNGNKMMSRLYAFESILSLTGANADYRVQIKPSQQGLYVANLHNLLAQKAGGAPISTSPVADDATLKKAADDLWANKGKSLVVSGSNDKNVQLVVNAINGLLGNYGNTLNLQVHNNTRKGNEADFANFVKGLPSAGGVIFYNCNPVYDHKSGGQIAEALGNVGFSLSTMDRPDETNALVQHIAPDHHYLESWNDFEAVSGKFSLSQPTISKIFNTRQAQDSFLTWAGEDSSYLDFIRTNWESDLFPMTVGKYYNFDAFWDKSLQDGVFETPAQSGTTEINLSGLADAATKIRSSYKDDNSELELTLYLNNSVGEGIQANNPWLQEMPDPLTKACWDNYLTVSPRQAREWGMELGDFQTEMETQMVNLTVNGTTLKIPVVPQPGQKYGTVGLALGYGRSNAGLVADGVGVNAYPLATSLNGTTSYHVMSGVSVEPVSENYSIAQTQTSQTYMGRDTVIQETILKDYQQDPQAGRDFPRIATAEGFKKPYAVSLWKGHQYANHHWGLVVDLNSCTGCGTCTIACQTENNIPVVGKAEVINRRDMHWIRIDRYYSSDAEEGQFKSMEEAAENPEVTFQPMMCQQCNNAPCETVCPVAATTHSSEGLNQMTYNRCIGTRYCANNCPYKVRRFNWFKYHDNEQFNTNISMNNDLGKMVLNPDVTVRSRGVMEKCTFCVQRIQSGKLTAKREGRRPNDGDANTACAAACPADALIFGDMKDPNSQISKTLKLKHNENGVESEEPRAYHVLEEIRVMPNVWYLTKVRNKEKENKEVEA